MMPRSHRMAAWSVVLAQLVLAAATSAASSSTARPSTARPSTARPCTARSQLSSGAALERSSQVGLLESSILGVLPSAMLTRYLSRLRLGGALNEPQVLMSTEELIRREGYPVETYNVRTKDGYTPLLLRIPHGLQDAAKGPTKAPSKASTKGGSKASTRPPVLITHGILQCSDNWVLRGKNHDLPFLLAEAGYDVWLANTRGSTYSRTHERYHDNDFRFWDYTLHEPGVYDLPAFMDKVLNTTGAAKLHYIGHSMGTTIFYILGSERPDLMDRVRLAVHLAPVTYWSRIHSPLAKRIFQASAVLKRLNMPMLFDNYFSRSNRSVVMADVVCRDGSPMQGLCAEFLFGVVGANKAQLNMSMLPMIFAHFPAGASVGQMAHYYQNYEQAVFHQYDYGSEQNIKKYGSASPPKYNLSRVTAPIAIWYGLNDRLVYHEDVVALSKQLPNLVGLHLVPFPKFNHFDFLWAKDSLSLLYNDIMKVMSRF